MLSMKVYGNIQLVAIATTDFLLLKAVSKLVWSALSRFAILHEGKNALSLTTLGCCKRETLNKFFRYWRVES